MFFLTLFVFITLALRGGVMLFYFRYYVDAAALAPIVTALPQWLLFLAPGGDPVAVSFSLFNAVGLILTIIGILFSKSVAIRYGKRNVFIVGLALTVLFTGSFAFYAPDSVLLMYVTEGMRQLAYGFTIPLLWAMMADVADYSEWRNNRRATGIVFSAVVFGLKAGLGFGGALGGYILSFYGYVPNVPQTESALQGIRLTASIYPAITFAIGLACLFFYRINRDLEFRISYDLAERRKAFTSTVLPHSP
jgi:glycoside/pentoside/hexuronide:cation symporter, GPH family